MLRALQNVQKVKSMVFLGPTSQHKIQRKMQCKIPDERPVKQSPQQSTKQMGDAAEDAALHFLQRQGLRLIQRNYRTPGRGGGEIDLILQESDSTLVFVEVRKRAQGQFGGALGSVSRAKQRRIIFAARYFLWRWQQLPPTRFDVVAWEASGLIWQKAAFDAGA